MTSTTDRAPNQDSNPELTARRLDVAVSVMEAVAAGEALNARLTRGQCEAVLSALRAPPEPSGEPDLRDANPIGLTPPQKELQRRQLREGLPDETSDGFGDTPRDRLIRLCQAIAGINDEYGLTAGTLAGLKLSAWAELSAAGLAAPHVVANLYQPPNASDDPTVLEPGEKWSMNIAGTWVDLAEWEPGAVKRPRNGREKG